jgi:hypothetical protein
MLLANRRTAENPASIGNYHRLSMRLLACKSGSVAVSIDHVSGLIAMIF